MSHRVWNLSNRGKGGTVQSGSFHVVGFWELYESRRTKHRASSRPQNRASSKGDNTFISVWWNFAAKTQFKKQCWEGIWCCLD